MDTQDAADQFEAGYANQPTETPAVAKEPDPKPEAAKDPEQKPGAEAKPEEEKKTDPLADALARIDKMQQSHDKLAGHIGRLERSYREIQANLATAQAAAKKMDDAPTQGEISSASQDPEEWAALKKQYPEWAAATERMVDARTKGFDAEAFEQKVNAAIDGKTAEMQARIIDSSLNAVFPGWKKTVATPEFVSWMDAQPEDVKEIRYSDDVGDVAKVLKLYEASKAAPAPQPSTKQEPSPREKRLAAAVAPKGTGGHPPGRSEEDEFEAGYNG
jgi:hypothetical protein